MNKFKSPKVLLFDIETSPILGYVWDLWEQNVALNMIHNDWHILSWSAKWLGDPVSKIMYQDQRNVKNIEDDKILLKGIWKLLNEADIVITQNGRRFDVKKLNARFIINGFQPPSSFKHIDTLVLAKRHFAFTSNKLEYLTNTLCVKNKKSTHKKFSGFNLWKQCLAGNLDAWKEMERYNKKDVTSLEELYNKLIPWSDNSPNFNLYHDELCNICKCGAKKFKKRGFAFTTTGKFQRLQCLECGAWTRDSVNLFSKEKRSALKRHIK